MKKYTCAMCGNEYESILERAKCETKCVTDAVKAAEEEKKRIENEMREESAKNIEDTLSELNEMIAKHFEKYSKLTIANDYPYVQYVCGKRFWF